RSPNRLLRPLKCLPKLSVSGCDLAPLQLWTNSPNTVLGAFDALVLSQTVSGMVRILSLNDVYSQRAGHDGTGSETARGCPAAFAMCALNHRRMGVSPNAYPQILGPKQAGVGCAIRAVF